eukprot:CAMPEP_0195513910 /NCGR_PEP_ID=MMETSP0794_2-20130614/5463_1 /TAXON_ID=515487 /ORGANISM="Stephanopyxis turris, Strain CCMP 815" /LENGTH=60 /DNA_ID=CAMNT_0040642043 /DNA_START=25 /DNA_END=207 /DNA_ORIENTATION=-
MTTSLDESTSSMMLSGNEARLCCDLRLVPGASIMLQASRVASLVLSFAAFSPLLLFSTGK